MLVTHPQREPAVRCLSQQDAARPWVSISAGCSEALGGSVLVAAGTGAVDGGDVILRGVLDAVKQEQADGSHFSMAMARDESQWTAKVVWTHRMLQGNT